MASENDSITFEIVSDLPGLRKVISGQFPNADIAGRSDLGGVWETISVGLPFVPMVYDFAKFVYEKLADKSVSSIRLIIIERDGKVERIQSDNLSPAEVDAIVQTALDGRSKKG